MESKSNALSALSDGLADAVEKVSASVVRVHGRRRRSGSGVVYAPEMVLTASHVLEREEDLTVSTHDGRTVAARFVGRDPSTDLAVLRVEGLDAEPVTPAEGEARIGQLALAVGRSGRTGGPRASLGVVSSAGGPLRMWRGARLEKYVQTDATPYPGISGGALVDARGSVVGILTTGLARGAALAIPADLAWRVAGTLSERGSAKRGYLGILSQPVNPPEPQKGGLLVVGVEEGSPAGRGGLLVGDIVTTLDSQPVEDTEDLLALLVGDRVGSAVPVGVLRGASPRRSKSPSASAGKEDNVALEPNEPSAGTFSSAGVGMIESAQESVVQVQSGGRGSGAGVIWPGDGLVMTNNHVIAGRRRRGTSVQVTLRDGRTFGAEVTRRSRDRDLALLRLEDAPGDLPAARIGDSDALRVGNLVYAIGHPWGRLGAVTGGIVSGLGVAGEPGGGIRFIQSDLALAPGNSGGPLLDARGEVVGINAMISGSTALSVPSNVASAWAAEDQRPRLGVAVRPVGVGREEPGLIVVAVEEASPAYRAGLLVGDVLVSVGDEPLDDAGSLLSALARSDGAACLRVRRGGSISSVDVSLGATGHAA